MRADGGGEDDDRMVNDGGCGRQVLPPIDSGDDITAMRHKLKALQDELLEYKRAQAEKPAKARASSSSSSTRRPSSSDKAVQTRDDDDDDGDDDDEGKRGDRKRRRRELAKMRWEIQGILSDIDQRPSSSSSPPPHSLLQGIRGRLQRLEGLTADEGDDDGSDNDGDDEDDGADDHAREDDRAGLEAEVARLEKQLAEKEADLARDEQVRTIVIMSHANMRDGTTSHIRSVAGVGDGEVETGVVTVIMAADLCQQDEGDEEVLLGDRALPLHCPLHVLVPQDHGEITRLQRCASAAAATNINSDPPESAFLLLSSGLQSWTTTRSHQPWMFSPRPRVRTGFPLLSQETRRLKRAGLPAEEDTAARLGEIVATMQLKEKLIATLAHSEKEAGQLVQRYVERVKVRGAKDQAHGGRWIRYDDGSMLVPLALGFADERRQLGGTNHDADADADTDADAGALYPLAGAGGRAGSPDPEAARGAFCRPGVGPQSGAERAALSPEAEGAEHHKPCCENTAERGLRD
jgi:hypothetical protein